MTPSSPRGPSFALHRPRLADDLDVGDTLLSSLLNGAIRKIPAHKQIIGPRQIPECIYRIRSGWCARVRHLPDGRAQMLSILLPGDYFAVESIFQTGELDAVTAIDAVTVESVERSIVENAASEDRRLMLRLVWQMLEDERQTRNWLVAMGQGSADEKFAFLLLDLRGRLALRGAIPPDALAFDFPMTQQQIAEALGLTAVHVNRTLKGLRGAGLVTAPRGLMSIDDVEGLHQLALPLLDDFQRSRPEFGGAQPSVPRNHDKPTSVWAVRGQVSA